jgi:hypothetical protein
MNTRRLRLEVEASEPKQAVEVQHGGKAEFVQAVPVQGEPGGQTVVGRCGPCFQPQSPRHPAVA